MEKVDVIIVGGGLAGLACAYELADTDLTVLVLERGDHSGSKNVTGGRIYLAPLEAYLPRLRQEAPLERPVMKERLTLLGGNNATTLELCRDSAEFAKSPSYTVLRARLDRWFADLVTASGVYVIPQKCVDNLIIEGEKVTGVCLGEERIGADCVVAADGVLSFLAERAGLRGPLSPRTLAVGFKEVIELPPGVIEDRFNLGDNEGAAQLFAGDLTGGMTGGGFLYTNKNSLSLGLVVGLGSLNQQEPRREVYRLLDDFRELPPVRNLIKGGNVVEYSAHLINEGGISGLPRLFTGGLLLCGDAAGLSLNMLVTVRGMEYALVSGILAGRAIKQAKAREDFSASSLACYGEMLQESFIMKEMNAFKHTLNLLENKRFITKYPAALCRLAASLLAVEATPKEGLYKTAKGQIKQDFCNLETLADWWQLRKV